MQLKTSQIAFAIEDTDGTPIQSAPRVVITLIVDDVAVGDNSSPRALEDVRREVRTVIETPKTPRERTRLPFIRSMSDVKVHVVPCRDCVRLTWLDRGAGIIESVVISSGAYDEALRALHMFCMNFESIWERRAD